MGSYISRNIRDLVARRAAYLCEYCLIHEDDTFLIGEVPVQILGFNLPDRIFERQSLIEIGKYPSSAALEIMQK